MTLDDEDKLNLILDKLKAVHNELIGFECADKSRTAEYFMASSIRDLETIILRLSAVKRSQYTK